MDRLTLKLKKPTKTGFEYVGVSGVNAQRVLKKLGEIEDLEELGGLVLYPQYAYFVKDNKIFKGWVQEVVYSVCRKPLYSIRYDDNSLASYTGYLGNDVFLTKEAANNYIKSSTTRRTMMKKDKFHADRLYE